MDEELEDIRERKKREILERSIYPDAPIRIDESNFLEMLEKYPFIVIDCWAAWCMPCKIIEPMIEELAREYSGRVVFGKLNVDENRTVAQKFGIMSIPTLLFFKRGKLVESLIGALPKEHIKGRIEKLL